MLAERIKTQCSTSKKYSINILNSPRAHSARGESFAQITSAELEYQYLLGPLTFGRFGRQAEYVESHQSKPESF